MFWSMAIVVYCLLSLTIFLAEDVQFLRHAVFTGRAFIWILGPPVTLVHQWSGIPVYAVETILLFALAWAAATRRTWLLTTVFAVCAIAFWLFSGFFALAVLI
jgi:hypothetical protein